MKPKTNEEKARMLTNQLNENGNKASTEFCEGFYQGVLIALNIADNEIQGFYDNIQAGNN